MENSSCKSNFLGKKRSRSSLAMKFCTIKFKLSHFFLLHWITFGANSYLVMGKKIPSCNLGLNLNVNYSSSFWFLCQSWISLHIESCLAMGETKSNYNLGPILNLSCNLGFIFLFIFFLSTFSFLKKVEGILKDTSMSSNFQAKKGWAWFW